MHMIYDAVIPLMVYILKKIRAPGYMFKNI